MFLSAHHSDGISMVYTRNITFTVDVSLGHLAEAELGFPTVSDSLFLFFIVRKSLCTAQT